MFQRKKNKELTAGFRTDNPFSFTVEVEEMTSLAKPCNSGDLSSDLSDKWGLSPAKEIKEQNLILTDFSKSEPVLSVKRMGFFDFCHYKFNSLKLKPTELNPFVSWLNHSNSFKESILFNLEFSSVINSLVALTSLPIAHTLLNYFLTFLSVTGASNLSENLWFLLLLYAFVILFFFVSFATLTLFSSFFAISDFLVSKFVEHSKHEFRPDKVSFLNFYKVISQARIFLDPMKSVPSWVYLTRLNQQDESVKQFLDSEEV